MRKRPRAPELTAQRPLSIADELEVIGGPPDRVVSQRGTRTGARRAKREGGVALGLSATLRRKSLHRTFATNYRVFYDGEQRKCLRATGLDVAFASTKEAAVRAGR